MYFVTYGGQTGYVLFSTTPHGRAAVGVTDAGRVRLLAPEAAGEWRVLREWPQAAYSHTELMLAMSALPEPRTAEEVLALLPAETLE
jgi:hypothetical protein